MWLIIVILVVVNYLFLIFSGDKLVASIIDPHLRRRCTKSKKGLVLGIINSHGLA